MKKIRRVGIEIMGLSNFIRAIICILHILVGLVVLCYGIEEEVEAVIIAGIAVIIIGFIVAWAITLILYGFGELIDQTMQTHYAVRDLQNMLFKKLDETNAAISSEVGILTEINKNLSKGT